MWSGSSSGSCVSAAKVGARACWYVPVAVPPRIITSAPEDVLSHGADAKIYLNPREKVNAQLASWYPVVAQA